jgi:hypothetical protein
MNNILSTLVFYVKYPTWGTYDKRDRATVRAVNSLVRMGYLETNEFNQARWTGDRWAAVRTNGLTFVQSLV